MPRLNPFRVNAAFGAFAAAVFIIILLGMMGFAIKAGAPLIFVLFPILMAVLVIGGVVQQLLLAFAATHGTQTGDQGAGSKTGAFDHAPPGGHGFCTSCGRDLDEGDRFCGHCGMAV